MLKIHFFGFFRPTQKLDPDGPKWGQEDFLPTKANLAKVAGFRLLLGLRMRNPIEEEEAETDPLQVEQADLQEERRPFGKVWINGKNPSPIGDVLNNFHGQEHYKTRCVCLFSLVGQSWMIFQARLSRGLHQFGRPSSEVS